MRLFNFLAQNGFIVTSSELRRQADAGRVFVNDKPIPLLELGATQVNNGDKIKIGKSCVTVFGVA